MKTKLKELEKIQKCQNYSSKITGHPGCKWRQKYKNVENQIQMVEENLRKQSHENKERGQERRWSLKTTKEDNLPAAG